MAGIWIYSEENTLAKELLTLGKELADGLNQPLCAVALNEELAKELVALGATNVIVLKGDCVWPEGYEAALAETLQEQAASIVIIGGSIRGKLVAAKIAARLEAGLASEAVKVSLGSDELLVERMIYGGLAVATESMIFPAIVTVAPHSYDIAVSNSALTGEIAVKEIVIELGLRISGITTVEQQGVAISDADRVVSIGRGLRQQEDLPLITALASALGAEVACSRPIAEAAKWLPVESYVGISGQKFKGSLYIAVGISGQIQHISGMRDAKVIVAVNSDETAPIFAAADYGIVGNLYDIVPLLTAAVNQAK
jgi:electron transfer flavoprotein alpha subunit